MKARISKSNLKYLLRGEYGFTSVDQFFKYTENHPMRNRIVAHIIREFTGYKMVDGKLSIYNPYTNKEESLAMERLDHIQSPNELMKELSMLHKRKMHMMKQSRERLVELSKDKKNTRDTDLEVQQTKESKRAQQLASISKNRTQEKGIDR